MQCSKQPGGLGNIKIKLILSPVLSGHMLLESAEQTSMSAVYGPPSASRFL